MSRRLPVLAALVAILALLAPPALAGLPRTGDLAPAAPRMSPGFSRDATTLAPTTPYGAFVRAQKGVDAAVLVAAKAPELKVIRNYPLISAAFVNGPIGSIAKLASLPSVAYLQDNAQLQWLGDTSSWATRVRVAQEAVAGGPYTDGSGNVLDGSGVGVAIVDAGINAAHPDLTDRVAHNYKVVCTTPFLINTVTETCYGNWLLDQTLGDGSPQFGYVEVPAGTTSDTSSGHGTHVAGIVAGTGKMSKGAYPAGTGPNVMGTYTGVAPGATLYGFGTGEVISVLWATEAFYYILAHHNDVTPAIKLVNNSWGNTGGTPFDPSDMISILTDRLVDDGVTVLFAAGNDGGTGSADATSAYCKNPKDGVICVANYDDETNPGGRDGALDASSSRGLASDSSTGTWPDIAAPGAYITSACVREVQPICNLGYVDEAHWGPWYSTISGTSMATPHVTGAAALLLQADPSLTPVQIEKRLQNNAYKTGGTSHYSADPQNSGGTTSYDFGAGLVDMQATLNAMGVSHGTASAASNLVLIGGDGGDFPGPGAADIDSLKVTQTTGSSSAPGFRYDLTVRNASDLPPNGSVTYRLFQTVLGVDYLVNVVAGATVSAGTATPATATAEDVSRVGNTISFFLPYSKLGNPGVGEPIFRVQAGAYVGTAIDAAPSSDPALVMLLNRPMFGKPYARA
jgi:serine protease AprX